MGRTPIIALLVALGVAAAPPAHAAVPVKVALRSLERNDAARDGRLTVRVAARRGTRVRVDAGSATRARTLRFRRTAGRTIRLRLTPAGRRALRACGARRLTVSVTGTRRGQRTRRQTRRLLRGTRPCRPDAPTAPGASPAPSPAAAAPGPPAASRPAPGEGSAAASATPAPTPGPAAGPAPEPPGGGPGPEPPAEPSPSGACDPLDDAVCLYPWPNEYFTAPDPRAETGRRLALAQTSMPRNAAGKPIVALDYNRADGFSPGSALITKVPGLDTQAALDRTGAVPITDMARYADPAQPVVVIDAVTRERHLIWAEIDVNPADPADRTLIVRPGKNFKEGRRYIAALRNLVREDGSPIEASAAFRTYRDAEPSGDAAVEARRPHLESLFATLGRAGIARSELFLAWDFTIASAGDRAGRMLSIRDRAFAGLGDTDLADGVIPAGSTAPPFTIDSVEESTIAEDPKIARTVKGTVRVPCFLANPGCTTGGRFALDPLDPEDDAPIAIPGNVYDAGFTCRIPHSALTTPARPSLYGHGLFGGRGEVESGQVSDMASEHGFAFCAADWIGMATEDVPNTATILNDLSNFPTLADRVQQGMLDFLFLGRAMIHPDGFGSDPAFRNGAGAGVLDTRELFYDGNSQGGIIGGSLMAVSPDARRGVLGVPAMNYSTLLQRSIDFVGECPGISYSCPLYLSYPNEVERQLLFGLIQQLWDRSESNGYAQHMTDDPYPNTPPHSILMHPAYGDHQVANVAAEVQARTIGARIRRNPIAPGRHTDVAPFFGIERTDFPFAGSAYEIWDSGPVRDGGAAGTGKPPTTNTPPTEGRDPHGEPRATPAARRQKAAFLARDGRVTDQCAGGPCFSRGYTGR